MPHITVTCTVGPYSSATEDQAVTVQITGLPAHPGALSNEDTEILKVALIKFAAGMHKDLKFPTNRPDKRTHTYWTLTADTVISYGTAGVLGNLFHTHVIRSRDSPGDHVALPGTDRD